MMCDMVIIYRGKVEEVARELQKHKDALDAQYVKILGVERAKRVASLIDRLLPAESFFDNPQEINKRFGTDISFTPSNKMLLASDTKMVIGEDGKISNTKIRTAPGFYISASGFEHSGSKHFTENPLASYVHEFDHFIWYVLQEKPFALVNMALEEVLQPKRKPLHLPEYVEQLAAAHLPQEEMFRRLILAVFSELTEESHEKSNRILDQWVLAAIGIQVPLEWRGKEKEYAAFQLPTGQVIGLPVGGDFFKGFKNEEVLERMIQWQRHYAPSLSAFRLGDATGISGRPPYLQNLIASLENVKVSRVSLAELKRLSARKKKRRD